MTTNNFKAGDKVRVIQPSGSILQGGTEWEIWDSYTCEYGDSYVSLKGHPTNKEELGPKGNGWDVERFELIGTSAIKSDGGSSSYYELTITNKAGESIKCETGDVIRTLVGNDFDFGNCVKALRRMYLATLGMGKEGTDLVYDANKIRWFLGEIERVNK